MRFWIETPEAFHTSMPLRPMWWPSSIGPSAWSFLSPLHGAAAVRFVPSTITVLRFIPRRWMPSVSMRTPAGYSAWVEPTSW